MTGVRRGYALLAAGAAAFVVYGSLVPFHLRTRPLRTEAVPAFRWAMENRAWPQSRSDGLANVLIAVPLGFALLGAVRAGRPGGAVAGVPVVAAGLALAGAVEFAQLFIPERTCAGSDVIAQGLGAAVGVGAWLVWGEPTTVWARRVAAHRWAGGRAGRRVGAYLLVVVGAQLLPLDLSASPGDLLRRLRSGPAVPTLADAAGWLGLVGLFVPAGLLAARVPAWPGWAVAAGGLLFAGLTEAGQLVVSRSAGAADVLAGGLGVVAGWRGGRRLFLGAA